MGWYIINKEMEELGKPCNICKEPVKEGDQVYLVDAGAVKDKDGMYLQFGVIHFRCLE